MAIKRLFAALLTGLLAISWNAGFAAAASQNVLVLSNAKIYTVDGDRSWAEALAIGPDGKIQAVGTLAHVTAAAGQSPEIIDLEGKMVLPGFQDVHLHALEAGINRDMCYFPADGSIADMQRRLHNCSKRTTGKSWIIGAGVNMTLLLEKSGNPVNALDEVVKGRPVLILDDLGHGALANSMALQAVGYDRLEGDPQGGLILRSEATGRPNGVVLENAQQKLRDAAFAPNEDNLKLAYQSLVNAQRTLSANGITSISDAGGYWPQAHPEIWARAEKEGTLTVRASNALYLYPDRPFEDQIRELKKRYSGGNDRLVRFDQIKIYVDGILSQATSSLYEPYEQSLGLPPGEELGFEYFPQELLNRYAKTLAGMGFRLHFHATGDRGAGIALNAIEAAGGKATGPHRITHLYLVSKSDMPRFMQLGVFADMQLAPSSIDDENLRFMTGYIGNRSNALMPIASLMKAGAQITLSSDWDADELSPLVKLQAVLMRKGPERIPDLATAIEMMTIQPARLLRHADRTGSLEAGKLADLVILDRNLFDLEAHQIGAVAIEATLLAGEAVFDPGRLFE